MEKKNSDSKKEDNKKTTEKKTSDKKTADDKKSTETKKNQTKATPSKGDTKSASTKTESDKKDKKDTKDSDSKSSNGKGKKSTSNKKIQFKEGDENALQEFLVDEVKDIYFAENEILKGLTKMKDAATSEKLKEAIEKHYNQTKTQIARLEQVFELFEEKPAKKKCEAIIGILKEGDSVIEDTEDGSMTRDVAIIIASQKVEHYEIATYGSLAELARTLNREDVAELFETTLQEEKDTDVTLTILATDDINQESAQEPV